MKKQFRSAWDILLISMTLVIFLILVAAAIYANSIITNIISISIVTLGIFFGVYGYSLRDEELRIIRLGWSKDVPYNSIQDVEYIPDAMLGSLRLFGIGGFFSYLGCFKNRILGAFNAYATHRKNTVVITTKQGKKIVVTPSKPIAFVEALKSASGKE